MQRQVICIDRSCDAAYHHGMRKHTTIDLDIDLVRDAGSVLGTSRVTANLEGTPIDDAVSIDDPTCVRMVYRLLREEGLFVGGSSGINVAAAVQVARDLGPGHTVVTVLADRGSLYAQRLFNPEWLREKGEMDWVRVPRSCDPEFRVRWPCELLCEPCASDARRVCGSRPHPQRPVRARRGNRPFSPPMP